MGHALISLGSNLGDRRRMLDAAYCSPASDCLTFRAFAASPWHETAPVGGPAEQDMFLERRNSSKRRLLPPEFLEQLQKIEQAHGRVREIPWGPRTLDLDLLLYDDVVLPTDKLTLPHPRLSFRKFVLQGGRRKIAGKMKHPVLGRTLAELLAHLESRCRAYVAFVGHEPGFRTQLAAEAADCAKARLVDPTDDDVPSLAALYGDVWPVVA